jgi:hypothetical protein
MLVRVRAWRRRATGHNLRSALSRITRMAMGSSKGPRVITCARCSLTKRDKINSEASQSYAGRKLIKLLGSNHIVILQCCTQAPKRTYRNILSFALNLALLAGETTALHAQPAPCLGRKRKIDKLTAREYQHPEQRATSEHAARLESRPEPLVRTSYRKISRCMQFE